MKNRKQLYLAKAKAASIIVKANVRRVTEKEYETAASKTGLTATQVENVWKTFTETCGTFIDGRVSSQDYIGKGQCFGVPSVKAQFGRRDVEPEEAAEILLYYMNTHYTTSRDVANKYQVSVNQIYEWIRELSVSGTLLGQMILNPRKYGKSNVKDIIWLTKHPKTQRKTIVALTDSERLNYERVAQVLQIYLKDLSNLEIEIFLRTAAMEDEELRSKRFPKKEEVKE
jgi:transposase-like protein